MDNTTMTKDAASCVASVRPRIAGVLVAGRLAAAQLAYQGTAPSVATLMGGWAGVAPVSGGVSVADRTSATFKTSDVVRSCSGRPPV
ncbi:MAG: hypothetical protein JWP82_2921 [Humibacillus sp.]|nr:hypothetical protein [Humibacillus sp.]